jgi:glycosyltransferase involved in cell wall biosynthesis
MNSPTLVSVIIPCYRQAHYLDEAIRSVFAQTYRHFEIIVVDDGSPDNTSKLVTRYAGLRFIRQQHLGLPTARNAGLDASEGEYTVFLDADDRLLPDALETGVNSLRAVPDCAFVYGFCEFIDRRGASLPTPPHVPIGENHYRALFKKNHIWTPGAVMFRRSTLSQLMGFDQSFTRGCEDIDLYLRITKCWPIQCHGKVVIQYRKHSASMSMKGVQMLCASNDLFRKHLQEVKGDLELEAFCRNKLLPRNSLALNYPTLARIFAALRVRTRLRAIKSYFQNSSG